MLLGLVGYRLSWQKRPMKSVPLIQLKWNISAIKSQIYASKKAGWHMSNLPFLLSLQNQINWCASSPQLYLASGMKNPIHYHTRPPHEPAYRLILLFR